MAVHTHSALHLWLLLLAASPARAQIFCSAEKDAAMSQGYVSGFLSVYLNHPADTMKKFKIVCSANRSPAKPDPRLLGAAKCALQGRISHGLLWRMRRLCYTTACTTTGRRTPAGLVRRAWCAFISNILCISLPCQLTALSD